MPQTITLFMWGYQSHFRAGLEYRAKRVFELLGAETKPQLLLVGLRRPGLPPGHPVCLEPEDGEWPLSLVEGLGERVAAAVPAHPLQHMFYSDKTAMGEKPDRIRRLVIAEEVKRSLDVEGWRLGRRTFCSPACPVGDYEVVCALQLPEQLFRQYPPIEATWQQKVYETSLIHACVNVLLEEGRRGLALPEPGRMISDDAVRSAEEIIRRAASNLMRPPFIPGKFCTCDLFEASNRLSQLRYEGRSGLGQVVLASADDPNISYVLRLAQPAPLTETRWARKLLQMATVETALIAEYGTIVGIGRASDVSAPPFSVEFLDHHQWDLRRGDQVLLPLRRRSYPVFTSENIRRQLSPACLLLDHYQRATQEVLKRPAQLLDQPVAPPRPALPECREVTSTQGSPSINAAVETL